MASAKRGIATRLMEHDYSVVVRGYGVSEWEGTQLELTHDVYGIKHKQDLREAITEELELEPGSLRDMAMWMPGYDEWVGLSWELNELREQGGAHLLQLYGRPGETWEAPPSPPPPGAEAAARSDARVRARARGRGGGPPSFAPGPDPDSERQGWGPPDSAPDSGRLSPGGTTFVSGAVSPTGDPDPILKAIRKAIRTIPSIPDQVKEDPEMSEMLAVRLVPMMVPRQFQQYQTIIDQGDDGDSEMYFLVMGTCEVILDRKMVAVLTPHQSFGEKCIGDGHSVRSATIRAQDSVSVGVLTTANFAAALSSAGLSFVSATPPSRLAGAARNVMMGAALGGGSSGWGQPPMGMAGGAEEPEPEPELAPWTVPGELPVEVVFLEPAKGQEGKLDQTCPGVCRFSGGDEGAGSCMDVDGTMQVGRAFSMEIAFSAKQKQNWQGVITGDRDDGVEADVFLGNAGCVAVGEVAFDADARELAFELELKYTVTPPKRLAQLAKGNADHLARLTKQSQARAGTYMCKLQVTGTLPES
jgi:hypothetical protein|eukprot:COSAG06_NODE_1337_length_9819_cov_85.523045_5_plen_529_part_00